MFNLIDNNIIGRSTSISQVKKQIEINAQYSAPVLITGETGTGKELAARGLHYSGIFADKPFIAVNCSTFTDELFASELFGYKKGAFTDAKTDKEGLITAACGGSLFFDEIDSLSLKSQTALLRLLQESEFRPVGSSKLVKANVRIIAAANCNLLKLIHEGKFRQDLYFRIYILSVNMPPLRERKEDLSLLIDFFIDKLNSNYGLERTSVSETLFEEMYEYHWPGNIRELENTIHRHYILSSGPVINSLSDGNEMVTSDFSPQPDTSINESRISISEDESDQITEPTHLEQEMMSIESTNDFSEAKRKAIEVFEAHFVLQMLKLANGNVTNAANLCGKERRAFGKLLKKYNIQKEAISD